MNVVLNEKTKAPSLNIGDIVMMKWQVSGIRYHIVVKDSTGKIYLQDLNGTNTAYKTDCLHTCAGLYNELLKSTSNVEIYSSEAFNLQLVKKEDK